MRKSGIAALLIACGLLASPFAATQEPTAEEVLEKTTEEVLAVIDEAADYVDDRSGALLSTGQ